MEVLEATVRAENSLLLVGDHAGKPPVKTTEGVVWAAPSCLGVGTVPGCDGATRVRLVASEEDAILPKLLAFDGVLQMGSGRFTVEDVNGIYLERPVPNGEVRVRVWVNHATEPDEVAVVIA
jgi:hypothetical protein